MRILQVISTFYPAWAFGGPVKVVYDLSKELARRGHEVEVFTTNAYNKTSNFKPKFKTQELSGFRVTYFNNLIRYGNVFVSPTMIDALNKRVKEFDVIHSHFGRQAHDVAVNFYAHKYVVPYVLQAHGSLPRVMDMQNLKRIFDSFIGYRLLKAASRVIALTQTEAQQYLSMGVPKEKIEIIPNGIDLSEYVNLPPKGSFKKKFGLDQNEKIVLYLGRIHKIKGIDILVRAFADILHKLDDVRLVIVGPDDGYLGDIEALTKALQIEDKVLFLGPLYGVAKLEAYVDADVYVLPSRYETFPMTVLEAYACAKPIIATKVGGLSDLVIHGKTGFLVEPYDVSELVEAITHLLIDEKLIKEIGCYARQFVMTEFSIEKVADKLERLYEEVKKAGF